MEQKYYKERDFDPEDDKKERKDKIKLFDGDDDVNKWKNMYAILDN